MLELKPWVCRRRVKLQLIRSKLVLALCLVLRLRWHVGGNWNRYLHLLDYYWRRRRWEENRLCWWRSEHRMGPAVLLSQNRYH